MARSVLRLVVGSVWVVGCFYLWSIPCNLAFFAIEYQWRGISTPYGLDIVYGIVATSGCVIIPPLVTVLAMRGRLPGTAQRPVSLHMVAWLTFMFLLAACIAAFDVMILGRSLNGRPEPYQMVLYGPLVIVLLLGMWIIQRRHRKDS